MGCNVVLLHPLQRIHFILYSLQNTRNIQSHEQTRSCKASTLFIHSS